MQTSESFGRFLLETVAEVYGCEPNERSIARSVYKDTACGAWIKFDEKGVIVGTIVEGSDAEYSHRIELDGIVESEDGADLLRYRLFDALADCDEFVNEVWEDDLFDI